MSGCERGKRAASLRPGAGWLPGIFLTGSGEAYMGAVLAGKMAVVTGAGRGIGRAVAKRFAGEGADVFAVARTESDLLSLKEEAGNCEGSIIIVQGDITERSFVEDVFRQAKESRGKLDILINNAGIYPFGSIFDMEPEIFLSCLKLNIWAAFLCTQEALKLMKENNSGKIINIGSVRSHWTESGDAGAYNASKYGLRGFTESVAREIHSSGLDISIGMVCPGAVAASGEGAGGKSETRALNPSTVAEAILYAVASPGNINVFDITLFSTSQKPW